MSETTEPTDTEARELTFSVYPNDGCSGVPFAVMDQERPDIPVGTLEAIQDAVDDAYDDGRLTVDEPLEEAGLVEYAPGKHDGSVGSITFNPEVV